MGRERDIDTDERKKDISSSLSPSMVRIDGRERLKLRTRVVPLSTRRPSQRLHSEREREGAIKTSGIEITQTIVRFSERQS